MTEAVINFPCIFKESVSNMLGEACDTPPIISYSKGSKYFKAARPSHWQGKPPVGRWMENLVLPHIMWYVYTYICAYVIHPESTRKVLWNHL